MTRALTLVVGIALAAIAIAPAALGEGRHATVQRPGRVVPGSTAPHSSGSAVGDALTTYRDPGPHRGATATPPLAANPTYTTKPGKDAPAKLAATRAQPRLFIGYEPGEHAARSISGREIEWSQIGIGVVLGVALAIGFALAVQAVRARPVAH